MRKIIVHMQSTLDNRIANAQGAFWEPFPWGEPEVAYVNQFFRTADTWALSRVMYDAIVPWWDGVATRSAARRRPRDHASVRRVRPASTPHDQGRVL